MFNYDGDLLFTCSDDKTVCMYNTHMLERVGLFQINDSCKSIDVTKDSKLLIATATTKGAKLFDCTNGDLLAEIEVPGIVAKQVQLSLSDKQFIVVFDDRNRQTTMRIYNVKDALDWGVREGSPDPVYEIQAPRDHGINEARWGPLDKSIYYCTDQGRLLKYDLETNSVVLA